MVKRGPTPPPADDTRFFTVMNPYPEQPYIALQDSKTFARWIACIIGQEHLLAFYHKPKSPNVVIIETSKSCPDFGRLMGEHRWREFLSDPPTTALEEASLILPCTLTSPRAMAKAGWVCRDVPSSWFRNWFSDTDSHITRPYPPPRHCEPPSEDVTRYPLCRPIPQQPMSEAPPGKAQFFASRRAKHTSPSSSDEDLPRSSTTSDFSDFPTTPPGLDIYAPDRFIPAIHGSDVPKASVVTISRARASVSFLHADADACDDDARAEEAERSLCSAHGTLCVSGICKECSARKREAKLAERALERDTERGWRGRGRGQGPYQSERESRNESTGTRREAVHAQARPAAVPLHLRDVGARLREGEKQGASPRSRVREDIRVEMASRAHTGTRGAKSVVSSATRALPPHLGKGSSRNSRASKPRTPAFTSSASDASSAAMSTSAHSDDSFSETSSSAPTSCSDPMEDASPMPFRPSAVFKTPDVHHPEICEPDVQRGASRPSRACTDGQEDVTKSVPTGAGDAFTDPRKHVCTTPWPAPLKRADNVRVVLSSASVRDAWDDDSSDDEEPF